MFNQLLSVIWDVNPEIFHIGPLSIRWYGIAWALTFVIGLFMFRDFFRREGYPANLLDSAFLWCMLSTIIGARLGHVLFYDIHDYLQDPITILYIWQGGLASHGAAIGVLIGLWGFSRKSKMPYIWSLDRIMLPVTIGGACVRIGNLMNSEIYGTPTDLPWGFEFIRDPNWIAGSPAVHPTQIYEALCYLVTFGVLMYLYYGRDMGRKRPGLLFGAGLIGVFLSRFIIEYIKNPQMDFEMDMSLFMGQWLSIPFVIAGVIIMIRALSKPAIDVPSTPTPVYTYSKYSVQKKKEPVKGAIPTNKKAESTHATSTSPNLKPHKKREK